MDKIAALNLHIANVSREDQVVRGQPRGVLPFITISRESGAGGQSLAKAILEAFESRRGDPLFEGWKIFDRELCELVANDPDLKVGFRSLLDESTVNAVEDLVATMLGDSPRREIHRKVAETIRELAMLGKAIIVGRGGECVTRDLQNGLHLRCVAPLAVRAERQSAGRASSFDSAEKWVQEQDRNRASFVKRLYGRKIEDPLLYDAIWNTDRVPLEFIAESAAQWVEKSRPS